MHTHQGFARVKVQNDRTQKKCIKMKIQLYDPKSSEIRGNFFPEEAFFVIITEKLLKNNTKASSPPRMLNLN